MLTTALPRLSDSDGCAGKEKEMETEMGLMKDVLCELPSVVIVQAFWSLYRVNSSRNDSTVLSEEVDSGNSSDF